MAVRVDVAQDEVLNRVDVHPAEALQGGRARRSMNVESGLQLMKGHVRDGRRIRVADIFKDRRGPEQIERRVHDR